MSKTSIVRDMDKNTCRMCPENGHCDTMGPINRIQEMLVKFQRFAIGKK